MKNNTKTKPNNNWAYGENQSNDELILFTDDLVKYGEYISSNIVIVYDIHQEIIVQYIVYDFS
jgi:hypothetical protein